MKLANDLKDRRFGDLLVKFRDGSSADSRALWQCQCDCGEIVHRTTSVLKRGVSVSCGCRSTTIDMVGKAFGRLTVKESAGRSKSGSAQWKCECVCKEWKIATGTSLRQGAVRSCGCLYKEKLRPPPDPRKPPRVKRHNESYEGHYRIDSRAHEHGLTTLRVSFA